MTALERRVAAQREKEKGNECMKCGEINAAVAYYSKSLELRPGDHLVLGNRAQAYIGIHCYYQAELDCDQALAIDHTYTKARYRRAVAKTEQGKYDEAEADLQQVLAEQADNKAAAGLLEKATRKKAKRLVEEERKRAAEEERRQYEAAPRRKIEIVEDSDDEEEEDDDGLDKSALEAAKAAVRAKEERAERAAKEDEESARLKKEAEVRLLQLGEARNEKAKGNDRFKAKDLAAAEQHYSRALSLLGDASDQEVRHERALVLTNRALISIQRGKLAVAEEDCTAAIAANAEWAKAHHRRGVARCKLGRLEEALVDLERAMRLEPDSTSTLDEIRRVKHLQAERRRGQAQRPPPQGAGARRVQIEEIESDEEEESEEEKKEKGREEERRGSRKVQVIEVDDSEEEEEEGVEGRAPSTPEGDGEVMDDAAVASAPSAADRPAARKVAITEVDDDEESEGEVVEEAEPAPVATAKRVVIETAEDESDSGEEWVQVHSPSKAKGPEPAHPAPTPPAVEEATPQGDDKAKAARAPWEEGEGVDAVRLGRAKQHKEAGDDLFRKGLFEQAVPEYTSALSVLDEDLGLEAEQRLCFLNRAACFLQAREYPAVIADCGQVLSLDPANVKALVRRGLAYEGMERPARAAADMRDALSLEFAAGAAQSPLAAKARECLDRCKRLDPSLKAIPIPVRAPSGRPASPPAEEAKGAEAVEKPVGNKSGKPQAAVQPERKEEKKQEEKKLTLREQLLGKKTKKDEPTPAPKPPTTDPKPTGAAKPAEGATSRTAESKPAAKATEPAPAAAAPKTEGKSEEELEAERRREAGLAARAAEAEEHKTRGNRAFKEGKFKAAVMHYSAAIDLVDDSACFHTNLAAAHIALKDHANALKMADKAHRLDPAYAKALYRKAQALEGLGRLAEAVAAYDSGLELLPDSKQMQDGRAAAAAGMQAQQQAPATALAAIQEKLKEREEREAAEVKAAAAERSRQQAREQHTTDGAKPKPTAVAAASSSSASAPKTAPEFKRGLKNLRKDSAALYAFLTLVDPAQLPRLLSAGVEEEDLVLLVRVLDDHAVAADPTHAFRVLQGLARVPRVSIVCAMLDRKDAKQLEALMLKLHPAKTGADDYDVKAWTELRKALGV